MAIVEKVEVEYATFDGWNTSTANCKNWDSLPKNAQKYIKFIEDFLQVPSNNKKLIHILKHEIYFF